MASLFAAQFRVEINIGPPGSDFKPLATGFLHVAKKTAIGFHTERTAS
jgi:hypothetical protein